MRTIKNNLVRVFCLATLSLALLQMSCKKQQGGNLPSQEQKTNTYEVEIKSVTGASIKVFNKKDGTELLGASLKAVEKGTELNIRMEAMKDFQLIKLVVNGHEFKNISNNKIETIHKVQSKVIIEGEAKDTKETADTFSITLTQPANGIITLKKVESQGGSNIETDIEEGTLGAILKYTNIKVELKARDKQKHVPSKLKINNDEYTTVRDDAIVHYFTIEKNTTIDGEIKAFFKITKNNVENGAIIVSRDHSGTLVNLLPQELEKVLEGKELTITLSANATYLPKSLSIKKKGASVPEVMTQVSENGKISKKIVVDDDITLSGIVAPDPNAQPLAKFKVTVDGVEFNMINIPATTEDKKLCGQDGVTLDAYQLSETEVTQELYEKIMGANPSEAKVAAGNEKKLCPVSHLTWYEAVAFCNELTIASEQGDAECVYYSDEGKTTPYRKADGMSKKYPYVNWNKKGFRLATEVEWEYGAFGGEDKAYPGSDNPDDVAWYEKTGYGAIELHEVKKKKDAPANEEDTVKAKNGYGLYDMAGNVAEWVWDPYVVSNVRKNNPIKKNPTYQHKKGDNGSCKGQVTVRGGDCASFNIFYSTAYLQCNSRDETLSQTSYDSIDGFWTGIRLARGAISAASEKVKVNKITIEGYKVRAKEMEKAESTEGFRKIFFPFTNEVSIEVEAEVGAIVDISLPNPISISETEKEVIVIVKKDGKADSQYKFLLKKEGRFDTDVQNGTKMTYKLAGTDVEFKMVSIAGIHDIYLGNIEKANNQPHKVSLSKYQISETEITQKLYEAVTNKNPSFFTSDKKVDEDVQELRPVDQVTWYDAVAFCNMLTEKVKGDKTECVYYDDASFTTPYTMEHALRDYKEAEKGTYPSTPYVNWEKKGFCLPTEAEWEWAAYGGKYGRYAGSNDLLSVAWCGRNRIEVDGIAVTREVAKKEPNGYGIYDMAGNVYEWCGEWWQNATPEGGTDPKGNQTDKSKYKVTRSSSYGLSELNEDRFEDAHRDYTNIDDVHKVCGIRICSRLF